MPVERIHRSNLVGMGVLPLTFQAGMDRKKLCITREQVIDIVGLDQGLSPRIELILVLHRTGGGIV